MNANLSPASPEAVAAGCNCRIEEYYNVYRHCWEYEPRVSTACPLHGWSANQSAVIREWKDVKLDKQAESGRCGWCGRPVESCVCDDD